MRRPSSLPIRLRVLFAISVLAISSMVPSHAAATAKPTATMFYSATSGAYKAWISTTSTARPAKSTAFPCNTATVAFYLEFAHAVPKHTKFQILVYLHTGNETGTPKAEAFTAPFTAGYAAGMGMKTVTDKPDFEGPYRAVLLVDGHATLHADFNARINGGEC